MASEEKRGDESVAWQNRVLGGRGGVLDEAAIDASLTPTERYGLRYREEVEPHHDAASGFAASTHLHATDDPRGDDDNNNRERRKIGDDDDDVDDDDVVQ